MSKDIEIPTRPKQASGADEISELFDSVDDMKRKEVRLIPLPIRHRLLMVTVC